jgi:hypothetical protein
MGILDAPSVTPRTFRKLRSRDLPGPAGLSRIAASPPTVTGNASSQIASSVLIACDYPGAFATTGGEVSFGVNFPDTIAYGTATPTYTSRPPFEIHGEIDTADSTGRFEFRIKANSTFARLAIGPAGGPLEYVAFTPTISTGATNEYYLVTMGAPGRYRFRLECNSTLRFYGIQCAPTDAVRAVAVPSKRMVVVGDSYTEPTVQDTGGGCGGMGWVTQLGLMLGVNAICSGSGGTGYLNPGSGGRTTFRGRSAEWLSLLRSGDILVFAGGVNDYSYNPGSGIVTAAQIGAEAAACFALCPAGVEMIVLSPFFPIALTGGGVSGLFAAADAIKAAAVAAGATHIDTLRLPDPTGRASTVLNASTAISAANFTVPTNAAGLALQRVGTIVQIGQGNSIETRIVTGFSGSGPYTIGVASMTFAHAAGDPVYVVGPSIITGTGRQGSTTGSGTADRFTGSDATHPTGAGHLNIAMHVHRLLANTLTA